MKIETGFRYETKTSKTSTVNVGAMVMVKASSTFVVGTIIAQTRGSMIYTWHTLHVYKHVPNYGIIVCGTTTA